MRSSLCPSRSFFAADFIQLLDDHAFLSRPHGAMVLAAFSPQSTAISAPLTATGVPFDGENNAEIRQAQGFMPCQRKKCEGPAGAGRAFGRSKRTFSAANAISSPLPAHRLKSRQSRPVIGNCSAAP